MITNKNEIKAYYETHERNAKEVAKIFNISYRTLIYWIKHEGWQKGGAIKDIQVEVLQDKLTTNALNTFVGAKKQELKQQISQKLNASELDSIILGNMLESSTDELLLKAMSLNFLHKNISLSAIIAKDELLKMVAEAKESGKAEPMIIACAEKVNRMFIELKQTMYGKEAKAVEAELENDYTKLSTDELLALVGDDD